MRVRSIGPNGTLVVLSRRNLESLLAKLDGNKGIKGDERDIAWAAGLFEGEGTIASSDNRSTKERMVLLSLEMTDEDVVKRFASIVGCGTIHTRKRSDTRKATFIWKVQGRNRSKPILESFYPYLGQRRLFKAQEALAQMERVQRYGKIHVIPSGKERSACTIMGGDEAPGYAVMAEEDEDHYTDRVAGEMHPHTQHTVAIRRLRKRSSDFRSRMD